MVEAMKFAELCVNGEDRTAEMQEITRIIGLDALGDRYSSLLHYQLAVSYLSSELNYHKVMREIDALERGQPTTTKPPTMFKGPLLGGLWHTALLRRRHGRHDQEPDQRHEPEWPAVNRGACPPGHRIRRGLLPDRGRRCPDCPRCRHRQLGTAVGRAPVHGRVDYLRPTPRRKLLTCASPTIVTVMIGSSGRDRLGARADFIVVVTFFFWHAHPEAMTPVPRPALESIGARASISLLHLTGGAGVYASAISYPDPVLRLTATAKLASAARVQQPALNRKNGKGPQGKLVLS